MHSTGSFPLIYLVWTRILLTSIHVRAFYIPISPSNGPSLPLSSIISPNAQLPLVSSEDIGKNDQTPDDEFRVDVNDHTGTNMFTPSTTTITKPVVSIRNATMSDLDDLIEVAVDHSLEADPSLDWTYPYRAEYPLDYEYWSRREYEQYLQQTDRFVFMVAEIGGHVVSLAVWDMDALAPSSIDTGLLTRKDANVPHGQALSAAADYYFEKYFAQHGKDQGHLWLLITRRDARRQGAGSALVKWGLELGRPVTIFASHLGELLYTSLGCKVVGPVHIQVDGEKAELNEKAMAYVP